MTLGVEIKRQRNAPRIFSAENKLPVNKNNRRGNNDNNNNKIQGSIDLVKGSPKVRTALTEMVKHKFLIPGKNCLHFKINKFVYKADISKDAYIVYHRSSLKMNKKPRYFKGPLNFIKYICKKFHVEMMEEISKKDPCQSLIIPNLLN